MIGHFKGCGFFGNQMSSTATKEVDVAAVWEDVASLVSLRLFGIESIAKETRCI